MAKLPKRTPEEFANITQVEFHDLWWNKAMTQRQIAKLYGVTRAEVVEKRKALHLNNFNAAMMRVAGGDKYKPKKKEKKTKEK